jgi:integrase
VIKTWLAERAKMKPETDAFFISERRKPLSRKTAWVIIRDYGKDAGLPIDAHPHMLRHARGFALADQEQNLENLRRNHYAPHGMCETNGLRSQGAKPCAPSKATFPSMRCRP